MTANARVLGTVQDVVRPDGTLVPPLQMTPDGRRAHTTWLADPDSAVFAGLLRDTVDPQFAAMASRYQS